MQSVNLTDIWTTPVQVLNMDIMGIHVVAFRIELLYWNVFDYEPGNNKIISFQGMPAILSFIFQWLKVNKEFIFLATTSLSP